MREMDDNNLCKSDNFDTQLSIKAILRVVSTVCPRDRTVTGLLHNKPTTNGLMANFTLAEVDLVYLTPLILQGSATRCSPRART